LKNINRLLNALLIILALELLCGLACIKSGLKEKERNLIQDTERFNKDYGSKGVTVKNKKLDWTIRLASHGLILKNSLIKNVELQTVDLRNIHIENSRIENVFIRDGSDFSGSTFKNVKFKNIRFKGRVKMYGDIDRYKDNELKDSIFINCEFVNCEFEEVTFGKEYTNCKFINCRFNYITLGNMYRDCEFINCKFYTITPGWEYINCKFIACEIRTRENHNGKFENVTFENSIVRTGFELKDSKNVQFINCLMYSRTWIGGKIENILIQNSEADIYFGGKIENILIQNSKADIYFGGNIKDIVIKDCPLIELMFNKGAFNNLSIINSKCLVTKFSNANLSNLLIKDSIVAHLRFYKSNISGNNKIENSEIWGNCYGKTKVRNLTIANCTFEYYVDIVLSDLYRLRLVNNVYKENTQHAVRGEKYIDSDKFPLEPVYLSKDHSPWDEDVDIPHRPHRHFDLEKRLKGL